MKKANRPAIYTPTVDQVEDYNQALYLAHRRSGLDYQTGSRRGQQLAFERARWTEIHDERNRTFS